MLPHSFSIFLIVNVTDAMLAFSSCCGLMNFVGLIFYVEHFLNFWVLCKLINSLVYLYDLDYVNISMSMVGWT